ncbi:hypothetical protein K504DRAFT_502549 [Pleomassaria siparia CBS 279.74]|uniref:Uncharacterized protein n=1 Tax=Pleomassaria siparia CBS 279.74 TaxID=1314801 RepID=A0A6G1KBM6_9PLEO|nr:hypothetical protein K504DRAFT_502549 [Pleomassaria siparia CBS 279.74]
MVSAWVILTLCKLGGALGHPRTISLERFATLVISSQIMASGQVARSQHVLSLEQPFEVARNAYNQLAACGIPPFPNPVENGSPHPYSRAYTPANSLIEHLDQGQRKQGTGPSRGYKATLSLVNSHGIELGGRQPSTRGAKFDGEQEFVILSTGLKKWNSDNGDQGVLSILGTKEADRFHDLDGSSAVFSHFRPPASTSTCSPDAERWETKRCALRTTGNFKDHIAPLVLQWTALRRLLDLGCFNSMPDSLQCHDADSKIAEGCVLNIIGPFDDYAANFMPPWTVPNQSRRHDLCLNTRPSLHVDLQPLSRLLGDRERMCLDLYGISAITVSARVALMQARWNCRPLNTHPRLYIDRNP